MNSLTNFERKQKRKGVRRAEAEQSRREREKIREKEMKELQKINRKSNRPANYRRDQNGNIILFGNIKISKTSGVVLAGLFGIIIFILVGGNPMFEMEGYEETKFSFEECEATDFKAEMCNFHYKFCRTYNDGKSICRYAETNPWKEFDVDENKWLPEEQDFLPPPSGGEGGFIFPFLEVRQAEARGQDEPACYTDACQKSLDKIEWSEESVDPTKKTIPIQEKTSDDLNQIVKDLRAELDKVKDRLMFLDKEIQQYNIDKIDFRNTLRMLEQDMDDKEDELKDAKRDYRHSQDKTIRTNEDQINHDLIYDKYKAAVINYEKALSKFESELNESNKNKSTHDENVKEYGELEDELKELLDALSIASMNANLVHREYQFVNIILSKTCEVQIKNGFDTKCPTIRELKQAFDNTIPGISGEFIDLGYDIKRLPTKYQNHWKYYEQIPWWKVVSVDPDIEMMKRGILITVQPDGFTFTEDKIKTKHSDNNGSDIQVFSNINVSDRCSQVSVSPDMNLIGKAIHHVISKCTTPLNNTQTIEQIPTPYLRTDSPAWQYMQWIKNTINDIKEAGSNLLK